MKTVLKATTLGLSLAVSSVALTSGFGGDMVAYAQQDIKQDMAAQLHQLFKDEEDHRQAKNAPIGDDVVLAEAQLLTDVSPAAYEKEMAAQKAFWQRLQTIDRSALSEADQLNYDLFQFLIHHRINNASYDGWRMPFLSDSGFFMSTASSVERMRFNNKRDYDIYIAKMAQLPAQFDQYIANMNQGIADGWTMPRIILDGVYGVLKNTRDAANAADASNPFMVPFFKEKPKFMSDADWQAVQSQKGDVLANVSGAYNHLDDFFKNTYMPSARTTIGARDLPGGADYYRDMVKFYTTLDITPEEVHQIGLNEVKRIRGEMDEIIKKVGFKGSFKEFVTFLRTDPQFYATSPRDLLKEASYIAKRIDAQMPRFFKTLPRKPYGVRAVPDNIAPNYTTGRYWGTRSETEPGYYMVNTYALDKRPLYALPSLSLHEGVPGHHHQNALVGEQPDVPSFRGQVRAHAFGEGWGLYTEKLGIEMGIYEDDYEQFGRLTYEMWRAGRLVVDTGMHFMGWTRDQAVNLFVENSALSLHNINTEVDRYISWPGQALAYKMGELTILRLRQKAEDALGEKFDIRSFHDAILVTGSLPMAILEQKIDRWIADQQAAE